MQQGETTIKLHLDREPRFYAWLAVDRCIWRTHDIANDVKMRIMNSLVWGSQHTTDFYWTGIAVKKLVHPGIRNRSLGTRCEIPLSDHTVIRLISDVC